MDITEITGGTVTTPRGFHAGAVSAGIKIKPEVSLDLAVLYSEHPCTAAGVFTSNKVKAAPVLVSRRHLKKGKARAIVVNSGCANACTSEQGLNDAEQMALITARKLGLKAGDVLVASTGVIGVFLPMEKIISGIEKLSVCDNGGHEFARAIMTTDTQPKEIAISVSGGSYRIGGAAKGAGMMHPDLATLLCFLTTDAAIEGRFLKSALQRVADISFNMLSIDGDTSTNDSVFLLANGSSGGKLIVEGSPQAEEFQQALNHVCKELAKKIVFDAEGATRLIEVVVEGAEKERDACAVAKTIVSSNLVKAAVHGCDPNWGRIICAVGRSKAKIVESRIDISIGNIAVAQSGVPVHFDAGILRDILAREEVQIKVNLKLGDSSATAWGCDLSEEYVTINSAYTT